MSNGKWDGKEERRHFPTDHDNLVRLLTSVEEHVKNFDKHVIQFNEHVKDDKFVAKMVYMGMGGLAVLQMIGIIKH